MSSAEVLRSILEVAIIPILIGAGYLLVELKSTIAELHATVQSLRDGLEKQDKSLNQLFDQTRTLGERLVRVESTAK